MSNTTEVISYAHLFDQCTQDWYAVTSILEDLLKQLKVKNPLLQKVHLRSDEAGCYHNSSRVTAVRDVAKGVGVEVIVITTRSRSLVKTFAIVSSIQWSPLGHERWDWAFQLVASTTVADKEPSSELFLPANSNATKTSGCDRDTAGWGGRCPMRRGKFREKRSGRQS